ncbi:hypothetical protein [Ascidiimonas sp. W6]|uniref:hypothetical protein n=1 Tax=Ascidiimonas meishanensis TaxID=3128903 RepID=UPI0030EC238A
MPTPDLQRAKLIDFYTWCMSELNVPLPPEKRMFKTIAKSFCKLSIAKEELLFLELERPINAGKYRSYTRKDFE